MATVSHQDAPGLLVAGRPRRCAVRREPDEKPNITALFPPRVVHHRRGAKTVSASFVRMSQASPATGPAAFREEAIEKIRARGRQGQGICG